MAKPTGFLEYKRVDPSRRSVEERIHDFHEFEMPLSPGAIREQAGRCMDCGVPACHAYGCPVENRIPDWNDMIWHGRWKRALDLLHVTNNFPEITGRVCPAPCEASCTLAINQPAVTIRHIELQIVERGWAEGWIVPQINMIQTGKRIAVIGSGPAGLAAAQQLARMGHKVVVFERSNRIGGLLRYGIPDYKLEKQVIDRRLEQMRQEGVRFETEVEAGVDISARYLQRSYDAILMTTGAAVPRDIQIAGRDLRGIHFAMDFLTQQNRRNAGDPVPSARAITAKGRNVVVLGGGDTGADCVGTARRQAADRIIQIELLPKPPETRAENNPWPLWPDILKTSSSHEEGCERMWSVMTKGFNGRKGRVSSLRCIRLEWASPDASGKRTFREIPDSEFEVPAELVLLAAGFVHTEHGPLVQDFDLDVDARGNVVVDENGMTSEPGIFAGGDAVTGASLVVTAIYQGRTLADQVHRYVMSQTQNGSQENVRKKQMPGNLTDGHQERPPH